ncbi:NB-ARC domain-containing protein [Streptomyces sp. NPDC018352]|uniref:ATP-binding protein n=1 Tax=Streptomyces sp. NPDC018352 TaxID=3157194 RepID=UPI00340222A9
MVSLDVVSAVVGWLVALCGDSGFHLVRDQRDERALRKVLKGSMESVVVSVPPGSRRTLENGLTRFFKAPPALRLDGTTSVHDALEAAVYAQVVELDQWVTRTTGVPFVDAVSVEPEVLRTRITDAIVSGLRQYAAADGMTELVRALDTAEILGRIDALGLRLEGLSVPSRAAATFSLPRDIASFTGRAVELESLMHLSGWGVQQPDSGRAVAVKAINGMAGIGKTAFAVRAAHLLGPRFPDGQLFLHLHGHTPGRLPVDASDALASLLITLGVPASAVPADIGTRAAMWRDRVGSKRILLVLDDAVSSSQVRPLLPGSVGSLVIITSRRRLTALEGVVPMSLETLSHAEATALFTRLAGRPGMNAADPHVAEVVRLCGCLPLAIRLVAGKLAHHPSWGVDDLIGDLTATQDRIVAMRAEDDSVQSAFDLSYRDLSPEQQRVFRCLGLFPGTEVDAYAVAALAGVALPDAQDLLDALFQYHLIEEPARGRYRLHDLMRRRAASLASLDPAATIEAAVDRVLDYHLHTLLRAASFVGARIPTAAAETPGIPPAAMPRIDNVEQALAWIGGRRADLHAVADFAAVRSRQVHTVRMAAALHPYLRSQGHWDEALALHRSALAAAISAGDLAGEAESLANLGAMQRLRGDCLGAVESHRRAREAHRQLGNALGEATAVHELGVVQRLLGDFAADHSAQQQARALYSAVGNRIGEANTLHELGTLHWLTGDLAASLAAQSEGLEIYRVLGNEFGMSFAHNELAVVCRLLGDIPAAATHVAHALDLHHRLGNRTGEAYSGAELGLVEALMGRMDDALATVSAAVDLHRELGNTYGMGMATLAMGTVRSLCGDEAAALTSLVHAVAINRDTGFRHGEGCALKEAALVRDRLGREDEADADLAMARDLHQRFGHRYALADVFLAEGDIQARRGHHEEARRLYETGGEMARETGAILLEAHAREGGGLALVALGAGEEGVRWLRDGLTLYERAGVPDARRIMETLGRL